MQTQDNPTKITIRLNNSSVLLSLEEENNGGFYSCPAATIAKRQHGSVLANVGGHSDVERRLSLEEIDGGVCSSPTEAMSTVVRG